MVKIAKAELGALSDISPNKIEFGGPNLSLPPNAAQALGLALHELATNAVKHGTLGQVAGKLAVAWDVTADSDPASRLSNISSNPVRADVGGAHATSLAKTSSILRPSASVWRWTSRRTGRPLK
jgi:two-component sensor histidine kinase